MDAGIYNRVSTNRQLDNFSIDEQARLNREYAARNNMTIVKEVTVDESASDLFRVGLDELLQLIEGQQIRALIVNGSDRLSRSTVDGLLLLESLEKSGCELHYATRGKVELTPEHRILHAVEFSMNEYWKFKLLQAMKRGSQGKINDGIPLGSGPVPYGYRKIGSKRDIQYVIDEEEAEIIREIFRLFIVEDMGSHVICRELNARGIPTYTEKNHPGKSVKGWTGNILRSILHNEMYAGVFVQNKMETHEYYDPGQKKRRTRVKRGTGKEVRIPVPAIIDRAIWEKAQEKFATRRQKATPKGYSAQYLLATRVRCGLCGKAMGTHTITAARTYKNSRDYLYYHCHDKMQPVGPLCSMKRTRADRVDALAWQHIRELLTDPQKVIEGFRRSQDSTRAANERIHRLIAETDSLLAKQQEELDNILALRVATKAAMTSGRLIQMQQDAEKLIESLAERRETLQASLLPEIDVEATVSAVQEFARQIEKGLAKADEELEIRKQIVAYLQTSAVLTIEEGETILYLTCVLGEERIPLSDSGETPWLSPRPRGGCSP